MEYSFEHIKSIANSYMEQLKNDAFKVAVLPNDSEPYYKNKMARDSLAIKNANPNAPLLSSIYEEL